MRKISIKRAVALGLPTLSILLAACAMDARDTSVERADTEVDRIGSSNVHKMPMHPNAPAGEAALVNTSAPAGAHLTYYGGPVLSNVKVWTVYWGSGVANQSYINSFYSTITSSAYFDWLSEYNTSTQSIGHGSLAGTVIDTTPPSGSTISDTQIQSEISKLITAGKLPANDANNLYMVYFPPGVNITQGGSQSCVQFCAYHGTFTRGGKNAYYGVIPDLSGACAGGCGTGTLQQNITSVSSHEMIEAVTDPAVGLATTNAAPLAWYDTTNGEIGDICNAQQAVVAGFTVQKEFSNLLNNCIATNGAGGSTSGSTTSSTTGAGGAGGSTTSSTTTGAGGAGGSGGGGSCSHGICTSGGKLTSSCDPCATKVCAKDSYCCSTAWDNVCVGEVASICGQSCSGTTSSSTTTSSTTTTTTTGSGGGGGSCAHAICTSGGKLTSTCDACAAEVCAQDSYCCSTSWDNICVGEVGSICGQSCP